MPLNSLVLSDCLLSLICALVAFSYGRHVVAKANETIHANELHIELALGE